MRSGICIGRRGQGKTTLALHIALTQGLGVAVFDPNSQFRAWPETTTADLEQFREMVLRGESLVIFRPGLSVKEDFEALANVLKGWLDYTFLIDEAWLLQGANWEEPMLGWLMRNADRERVKILQTVHRPTDASNVCRNLVTDWYIFCTRDRASLEVIADKCGPEVAEAVSRLEAKQYVHWDEEAQRLETSGPPSEWFRDMRRPSGAFDFEQHVCEVVSNERMQNLRIVPAD